MAVMKLAVALGLALAAMPARAEEVTPKDIQVIGRTLGFMEDVADGAIELGIVYVRGEPASAAQAASMQRTLNSDPATGKVRLQARLIAADELAALDHIGALFIVPAAINVAAAAAAAAHRLHVPVISNDIACATAGHCALAFNSLPTVEIIFNRSAAEDAGVHFTPAFRMLVKKI